MKSTNLFSVSIGMMMSGMLTLLAIHFHPAPNVLLLIPALAMLMSGIGLMSLSFIDTLSVESD